MHQIESNKIADCFILTIKSISLLQRHIIYRYTTWTKIMDLFQSITQQHYCAWCIFVIVDFHREHNHDWFSFIINSQIVQCGEIVFISQILYLVFLLLYFFSHLVFCSTELKWIMANCRYSDLLSDYGLLTVFSFVHDGCSEGCSTLSRSNLYHHIKQVFL